MCKSTFMVNLKCSVISTSKIVIRSEGDWGENFSLWSGLHVRAVSGAGPGTEDIMRN